jgi:hypothetical protein
VDTPRPSPRTNWTRLKDTFDDNDGWTGAFNGYDETPVQGRDLRVIHGADALLQGKQRLVDLCALDARLQRVAHSAIAATGSKARATQQV